MSRIELILIQKISFWSSDMCSRLLSDQKVCQSIVVALFPYFHPKKWKFKCFNVAADMVRFQPSFEPGISFLLQAVVIRANIKTFL